MSGRRPEFPILLFTCAYLATAAVAAAISGNTEFLYYIAVVLVLGGAVWAVHRRVTLRPAVLWGLSAWGLAHMAGGLLPVPEVGVLYNLWLLPGLLKYDQLVHAAGFGLTTWICWEAIRPALADPRSRLGPLVLCAAAGCGFGALNEVIEFLAVLTIPDTNVGGYENTAWDLVANLVGAVIAVLWIRAAGAKVSGAAGRSA